MSALLESSEVSTVSVCPTGTVRGPAAALAEAVADADAVAVAEPSALAPVPGEREPLVAQPASTMPASRPVTSLRGVLPRAGVAVGRLPGTIRKWLCERTYYSFDRFGIAHECCSGGWSSLGTTGPRRPRVP